jgi:putative transposase
MSASTQNAHVERFNLTVRHEWLNMNMFGRVAQAKELPTHRLWKYNNERPNKAFGVIPPATALKAA